MSTKRAHKKTVNHLLILDSKLDSKLRDAAAKTHLSKQSVMRMSLDRGIDILLSQLLGETAA